MRRLPTSLAVIGWSAGRLVGQSTRSCVRARLTHPCPSFCTLTSALYGVCFSDGKPSSQLVSTEWKTDWSLYMSASKGVVYVKVDVRGSRGQSTPDLYQNLGVHEIDDQINVVRYVRVRVPPIPT